MKEEDIIELLKTNRYAEAGEKLYAYFPVVKKLVLKNSGSREDAEDIYQEALIVFIGKLQSGDFVLTSNLSTYLYGICRLMWNERLRKNAKRIEVDPLKLEDSASPEEDFLSLDDRDHRLAEAAFRQLGEKCRQLLLSFYFKKLSMREIAGQLGFGSEKIAKNQKYRCLEKAKEHLKTLKSASHE